jgi:hypothetical protein
MSFAYTLRNATTTNTVGANGSTVGSNDIYANTRFFTSFDLTTYSNASININGPTADGSIIRTETVPTGTPPEVQS